jgi:hypothetical protein
LIYGSSFCIRTRRPRRSSSKPIDAEVSPLPRLLTTPPVTKMCFVCAMRCSPRNLGNERTDQHKTIRIQKQHWRTSRQCHRIPISEAC